MVTLARWIQDWRRIAERVPDGCYEPITVERDGRIYEILQISGFDPDVDGERRVVRTATRDFDDKVALFSHLTRDIGLVRVIAARGKPRYVLEPGADVLEWTALNEGVSVGELMQAVREGALGRRVARLVTRRDRRSREALGAKVQALRERFEDAETELALMRAELQARERELARLH